MPWAPASRSFYRLLFTLIALVCVGYGWAWLNLRGLEVRLFRVGTRGHIGEYLDGQIQLVNRTRMPKSWLEIVEDTDLRSPADAPLRSSKGSSVHFESQLIFPAVASIAPAGCASRLATLSGFSV